MATTTQIEQEGGMIVKLGLRSILLLVAIILFVVASFADRNALKWLAGGLAFFAGAFLLGEMGGRRGLL